MRQFRLTATSACKIIENCHEFREGFHLEEKDVPFELTDSAGLVNGLCKNWFSTARSTEPMMRGTLNEHPVFHYLKRQPYTKAMFSVGLLALKESPWLASSPDIMLMLDMSKLQEPFRAQHILPWVVEIKTSIAAERAQNQARNASSELIVMDLKDLEIKKHICHEHMRQMVHQALKTNVTAALYVSASESQVLYVIAVMFDETILEHVLTFVDNIAGWAHDGDANVALDKYEDEVEDVLLERTSFSKAVNDYIRNNGSFMPIRIFQHSAQSFYSRTREGVDGNSQTRAVLKCPSSSQKWEQKVVTHTFKTILVTAFVSWRMLSKEELVETRESFGDLNKYRHRLNKVQCIADYAHDVALELLEYADELARNDDTESGTGETTQKVTPQEKLRLIRLAKKTKAQKIVVL